MSIGPNKLVQRPDAGFTLLEVIVALAIASASIASLYQIYALGWRGERLAALDNAALQAARNQLASAGVETPLEAGSASGVSGDGISWSQDITPYAGETGTERSGLTAFWVSVRVGWREGPARPERSYELKTIKLKSTP